MIEIVKPRVNAEKMKRKTKHKSSYHRDNKTFAHSTIGGLGLVARLFKR